MEELGARGRRKEKAWRIMDFDVLLELNKTPGKKQGCETTTAHNASNRGNCFPFVFFLYSLILGINCSGLYFHCNKRCIVKGRWRQGTLLPAPRGPVPPHSCCTKLPKRGLEAAGRCRALEGCDSPKSGLMLHVSGRLLPNVHAFQPVLGSPALRACQKRCCQHLSLLPRFLPLCGLCIGFTSLEPAWVLLYFCL